MDNENTNPDAATEGKPEEQTAPEATTPETEGGATEATTDEKSE